MPNLKLVLITFCFLVLAFGPASVLAQSNPDSTTLYRIETTDGNKYLGYILASDTEKIQLKTEKLGTLPILRKDIKSLTAVNSGQIKNGKYWFDNPQSTRYLFSPNGYGLKPGEGYYQNVLVFVNQVSVGITNNVSMGVGIVPLFLFGGSTPVWLLPKVSFPVKKDKVNIGAGALVGTALGEESGGFGIVYGLTTFGSRDKNVSLGLGYGYAAGDWAKSPTITFSGLLRTGNRGYLLTENYLIGTGDGSIGLISAGGRRIIKRVGLDFGLLLPVGSEIDGFFALPFIGFTVPFNQNKSKLP